MHEKIYAKKNEIKILLEHSEDYIQSLSSEELFHIILVFAKDDTIRPLLELRANQILNRSTIDYDMYNCLTILCLKIFKINLESVEICLNNTIEGIFFKESIALLKKIILNMKNSGGMTQEELFNQIISYLKKIPTEKSSKVLFDFYNFPDFKLMLNTHYRTLSTLLEAYQLYNPEIISSQIINGSTIIGKLLDKYSEEVVYKYLINLLKDKHLSTRNIRMIGGGGSCLVFKINDMVIKLGEERNNRKVYINHRILASFIRKLEKDSNDNNLFYVEVMKYALTGDVTPEERDELLKDLRDQGLIWDDYKLENCGVLVDGDENYYDREIDYSEYAGHIDNPERRLEFNKRKRRVVVIDNDHISFNPLKSCR